MDHDFNCLFKKVEDVIDKSGVVKYDNRFKQYYKSLNCMELRVNRDVICELQKVEPKLKFYADLDRMLDTLRYVIDESKTDINSRRLLVLNTEKYLENFQCFQSLQFIHSDNGNFEVLIYQRSSNLKKFYDDITYFCYLVKRFEVETGYVVQQIKILYGNIHKECSQD